MTTAIRGLFGRPVAGVKVGDLVFGIVLSLSATLSADGLTSNSGNSNAGPLAALVVLLMTAPVVIARRRPLLACAVLAVGAPLNWLLIGHLIRCGAGLVAVFYTAFAVGMTCDLGIAVAGVALLAANITSQAFSDPTLGTAVLPYMIPAAIGFAGVGRLLASRNATVAALQARTEELRREREDNARLAVATDQARIAGHLDDFLAEQVDQITETAAAARASVASDPERTRAAFRTIGQAGRAALGRMREVVAGLEWGADTVDPAPTLAQLDRLLAEAGESAARLEVIGDPRLLAPGLELSVYRIVERLMETTQPGRDRDTAVAVTLRFERHELQVSVAGLTAGRAPTRAALAAAEVRAAVHSGRVSSEDSGGVRTTVVALPLTVGHV